MCKRRRWAPGICQEERDDGERQRQAAGSRSGDRRGGPHAGRPRPHGEGLLQGPSSLQPPRQDLQGADRPLRDRPGRGRRRDRGLRPAVGRAVDQHRPQRLARGGAPARGPGDHARPPVRLRPAGRRLRRDPGRLRRPRRGDRRRRRAHGQKLVRQSGRDDGRVRLRLLERADGALRPDPAGPLGRDDRRQMGDPALGARRIRRPLPAAGREGDRGGPLRAGDGPDAGQRRHLHDRPGAARDHARGAGRPQARLQGGRQDHRRQLLPGLRRRRRGAADDAARRPTSWG